MPSIPTIKGPGQNYLGDKKKVKQPSFAVCAGKKRPEKLMLLRNVVIPADGPRHVLRSFSVGGWFALHSSFSEGEGLESVGSPQPFDWTSPFGQASGDGQGPEWFENLTIPVRERHGEFCRTRSPFRPAGVERADAKCPWREGGTVGSGSVCSADVNTFVGATFMAPLGAINRAPTTALQTTRRLATKLNHYRKVLLRFPDLKNFP